MASSEETVVLRLQAVNEADAALGKVNQQINELKKSLEETNKRTRELAAANSAQWVDSAKAGAKTFETLQKGYGTLDMAQAKSRQANEAYQQALAKLGSEGSKHLKGIGDELAHHVTRFVSVGLAIEAVRRGFDKFAESSRGFERIRMETGATVHQVEELEHSFENLSAVTGTTMPNLIKEFRNFAEATGIGFTDAKKVFTELVVAAHAADANIGAMGKSVAGAMTNLKVPMNEILGSGGLMDVWTKTVPANMQEAFGEAMQNITPTLRSMGIEGRTAAEQLSVQFAGLSRELGSTGKATSALDSLFQKAKTWSTPLGKMVLPEIEKFRGDADAYNKSMQAISQTISGLGLLDENMSLVQRSLLMQRFGITETDITAIRQYNENLELTQKIAAELSITTDEVGKRLLIMAEGPQAKQDELNAKLETMYTTLGKIYMATGLPDSLNKFLATTLREVEGIVKTLKWLDDYFLKTSPGAPAGQGSRKTGAPTKEGVAATGLPLQPGEAEAKAESDRIIAEEDRKKAEEAATELRTEEENKRIEAIKKQHEDDLARRRKRGRAFAQGGEFRVPGSGASDTEPVEFMATPGEKVTISPKEADTKESLQRQQDKADIAQREHFARFHRSDRERASANANIISAMLRPDDRSGGAGSGFDRSGRFVGTDSSGATSPRSRRGSGSDDPAGNPRTGTRLPAAPPARTTPVTPGVPGPPGGHGPPQWGPNPLEGRQQGGPVNAGQPYRVGEAGPEVFVPRAAGTIVPTDEAIREAAQRAGMDVNVMRALADIESSKNPESNRNKRTQYKGLYQLNQEEQRRGGGGDLYNARDNALAFANLVNEDKDWFTQKYGRAPTDTETYMIRQQGRGFFTADTPSQSNMQGNIAPGAPRGPQTRETFMAGWENRINQKTQQQIAQFGPSPPRTQVVGPGAGVKPPAGPIEETQNLPSGIPGTSTGTDYDRSTAAGYAAQATLGHRTQGLGGLPAGGIPKHVMDQVEGIALKGGAPAVKNWIRSQGYDVPDAWCGATAAAALKAAGRESEIPQGHAIASNWRKFGEHTDTPAEGDIASRTTNRNTGQPLLIGKTGGHVTTYKGEVEGQPGKFYGRGGNQGGGRFTTSTYNKSDFEFRTGKKASTPGTYTPIPHLGGTQEAGGLQRSVPALDSAPATAGLGKQSMLNQKIGGPTDETRMGTDPRSYGRPGDTGSEEPFSTQYGGTPSMEELSPSIAPRTRGRKPQSPEMMPLGGVMEARRELEKPIEPVIKPRMQALGPPSLRWSKHTARQQQTDQSRQAARSSHTDAGFA